MKRGNGITKSSEKEKLLKDKTEQLFSETVSSINIVLYSTNAEGTEYNFITDAVRTLFGFSPEEIYKNKTQILRSIYPAHFDNFKSFINNLKNGIESTIEYRMKDRFGKEHWVRHSGFPIIKNNKTVRVVGAIQDITEEKQIQLRLEGSEEKFRLLIDTAEDLIFILNGFGYFNMVNKNGATALGYTPDEMIGKHFLEFIDKEDEPKIAAAFTEILNSNGITTFEAMFLDRSDKGITFEFSAKPMLSDGEVSGMLSIGRNITNRKLDEHKIKDLNAKLVEANRIISIERERARHKITVLEEVNKLKSEFISNVSHELRTPLASIVGFAETILSDPDLPKETIREFSNIILMEGKRLGKLINDVLDFSKLESGEEELQKSLTSIVDILEESLINFSDQIKEKNITLSKEYPKYELQINVDKDRLKKVFGNLISNAVKFTNAGGRITVILQDYGKEIEIVISDTGVGIPEKDLPNLFQKFSKIQQFGTPLGGAGFGLVSVKQIVDLHKGFIKARSQVNKGTTFIIRLPK
ncbi:MAG: PAS domain-containing sensor histidine kinase [Bacteroidota bacterium]